MSSISSAFHRIHTSPLNPSASDHIQWVLPSFLQALLALTLLILGSSRTIITGLWVLFHSFISTRNFLLSAPLQFQTEYFSFHNQPKVGVASIPSSDWQFDQLSSCICSSSPVSCSGLLSSAPFSFLAALDLGTTQLGLVSMLIFEARLGGLGGCVPCGPTLSPIFVDDVVHGGKEKLCCLNLSFFGTLRPIFNSMVTFLNNLSFSWRIPTQPSFKFTGRASS